MVIGIIGAGASGMAAAIAAAQNPEIQVVLMERQARVGKKLLATGNGRCNLSNKNASGANYYGENPAFAKPALERFPVEDTLRWFGDLGLFTVTEDSGKIYPYSDQANSVVDVLRFALMRPNISLKTGFDVRKVRNTAEGFLVQGENETVICDKLIVACGGLAGTKLGGSMSGYKLLSMFGHKTTKLRPSLVQLKTVWGGIAGLKGVRANCNLKILRDNAVFTESTGEIQFTDYGISGPVVFEVSRDVCHGNGIWSAQMDFLPDCSEKMLREALCDRRNTELTADELLTGIVHNRLGRLLVRSAGLRDTMYIRDLDDSVIASVCRAVKCFSLELSEPMGMDNAQVTAGGIITNDFDSTTMESKLVNGLYACSEVLDIDGDCGGYNLQWAWSSGRLAGESAAGGIL